MIEMEERLRTELARAAAAVRPAPDPLRRLLARRRQRRLRTSAVVLAVLVALTGGTLTTVTAQTPDPTPTQSPHRRYIDEPITSEWTRRLLAGPTRGNLAGNTALVDALTRELTGKQESWSVDPALDRIKVLVLADVDGARMFGMSYHNDTRAVFVTSSAPAGTTLAELATGMFGGGTQGLRPFMDLSGGAEPTGRPSHFYVSAVAPPGCVIATSAEASFSPGGTVTQTWVDHGDHLVRPGKQTDEWWRVTCDGVVREIQPGYGPSPAARPGALALERGQVEPALLTAALDEWRSLPGLTVTRHRALWGGTPPGGGRPVVVLIGESSAGPVQVCAYTGGAGQFRVLATTLARDGGTAAPGVEPDGIITTGVAASAELVAVRLPTGTGPYLSDRLLVIAPEGATELRVSGSRRQTARLVDGVGVITAPAPARLTMAAVDRAGTTLARSTLVEPDADGLMFGQAVLSRW